MSAFNDYVTRQLNSLDRLLPRSQSETRRRPLRRGPPAADFHFDQVQADTTYTETSTPNIASAWPPTLETVLMKDPPEFSALLGLCEDGLPFLLDLTNPAPGAILLTAGAASGKTELIRSLLVSASRMNPPERVAFSVIAAQPEEYLDLGQLEHCQEVFPVEDPAVDGLIADLVALVEARKRDGPQGPALILAIDDLAALLPFLEEQAFSSLYWLIRHGPRYRVWTLAALPSAQVNQIEPRYLTAFRTRLFGHMLDERLARTLANDDDLATRDLVRGSQFFIPYDGDWLRCWICKPAQDQPLDLEGDPDAEGGD
jgi:hypothetical protein